MTIIYSCQDCSYQGKQRNQLGQCPACGSYNYRNRIATHEQKPVGSSPLKLVMVVILWGYFIAHIYWKLNSL